ncbi:hypothetical protein BDW72DRAFT_186370 [Aspergillus terricola var. indicus]
MSFLCPDVVLTSMVMSVRVGGQERILYLSESMSGYAAIEQETRSTDLDISHRNTWSSAFNKKNIKMKQQRSAHFPGNQQ